MRDAGAGGHPRAADRGRLGHELVRLDEDPRRPRLQPAPQARRQTPTAPRFIHTVRGVGFRFSAPERGVRRVAAVLSLRTTLLAAFAYVLVLAIVALEVPLALNLVAPRRRRGQGRSRRPGADHRRDAPASGSSGPPRPLQRLVDARRRASSGGRVIVRRRRRSRARRLGRDRAARRVLRRPPRDRRPRSAARPPRATRHSDSLGEDLLFTAVPVFSRRRDRRRGPCDPERRPRSMTRCVATRSALVGVGLAALLLGLARRLGAGRLSRRGRRAPSPSTARRVAGGDLDARATEAGAARAARGRAGVQRDDGAAVERARRPARVRRQRLAPAAHAAHRPAAAARGGSAIRPPTSVVAAELAAAEDEVIRLSRLIDNLLTLARRGPEPPRSPRRSTSAPSRGRRRSPTCDAQAARGRPRRPRRPASRRGSGRRRSRRPG